ncbi:MAG: ABC transporter permease [Cyclobacteriaceae bacterium]
MKDNSTSVTPPKWPLRFFRWFCNPDYVEDIEGDLIERFDRRIHDGKMAKLLFAKDTLLLFRPGIIKSFEGTKKLNFYGMFKHNFKISYRTLLRKKTHSLINIGGLALGLSIAILISLWVYDELIFNTYHENYKNVAQVLQKQTINGDVGVQRSIPYPLGDELRNKYGSDFKHIVMSSWFGDYVLSHGQNVLSKRGGFMDVGSPHMLSLEMLKGTRDGLTEQSSILISQSLSTALFGNEDPMGEMILIYNEEEVLVTGVYLDLPHNSRFKNVHFIAPWDLYVASQEWVQRAREKKKWDDNSFQLFVQIVDHSTMQGVSEKIKKIKYDNVSEAQKVHNAEMFLNPMKDWHLRSNWKNGVRQGGPITYVWLFGAIGIFVLLLACINFMNLSTAHSVGRAKEVGVRKSIGSFRGQLIVQFLTESILVAFLAFLLALAIVVVVLPQFNLLADKQMTLPFDSINFWMLGMLFVLFTGLLAGSYPALYLSSFRPVQVLKGTFKTSLSASVLRKGLVIFQFTVSVILIVSTLAVREQIAFTSSRPTGYDNEGTIMVEMSTQRHYDAYNVIKNELNEGSMVLETSLSSSPLTEIWNVRDGFKWEGMDPDFTPFFPVMWVSHDYGKTINWNILQGRDFSTDFTTDSTALIINETAVTYMGLSEPIGKTVRWQNKDFKIIAVIKDVLIESPFRPIRPTIYTIDPEDMSNWILVKLNPDKNMAEAVSSVEEVFTKHIPDAPFEFDFAKDEHAEKFEGIIRIGNLSTIFALLAILISCLGLLGLASFMAEQRTKEIGIRKVLGASIQSLWKLLSREFVLLVSISCLIALPIAFFALEKWLQNYEYRTDLHWSIFVYAGLGALLITLFTVSFQSIKAAVTNPVESLRSE